METGSEGEVSSNIHDLNEENLFFRRLEKLPVYLAIAGIAAGIGSRAIESTQETPLIDESSFAEVKNAPAQAPGTPSEVPATAEQYAAARDEFEEIKSLILELDPNKTKHPDTQQMWPSRSSTSAMITEARVAKIGKKPKGGNTTRYYSVDLKHVDCRQNFQPSNPAEQCTNRHFREFPLLSPSSSSSGQQLTQIFFNQINAAGNKIQGGDRIVLAFNGEKVELQLFDGSHPAVVNHQVSPNARSFIRRVENPPEPITAGLDFDPFDIEGMGPRVDYFSSDYNYLEVQLSEIKQIFEALKSSKSTLQNNVSQQLKNRF